MNRKNLWIAGIFTFVLTGCNAGMAPEPMSDSDLKSTLDKLPPQDQINYVKSTPMTAEQKAARIKEIEDKTGHKDQSAAPQAPKTGP